MVAAEMEPFALKPDAPAKEFGVITGFACASGFNGIVPAQLAMAGVMIKAQSPKEAEHLNSHTIP